MPKTLTSTRSYRNTSPHIYHGKTKWKVKNGLLPLFDAPNGTEQYIPDFSYELFDISHIPEDTIKGDVLNRACLLLLRSTFDPQQFEKLPKIFELISTLGLTSKPTEYIGIFIRYLVSTVESSEKETLTQVIKKSIKYGATIMPTIAEKWLQEGIEQGIEQGIARTQFDIVTKMIENNMSNADIRKITGIAIETIIQIRKKVK